VTDQLCEKLHDDHVTKRRARRKPRALVLETVLTETDKDASVIDKSLNGVLADYLTRIVNEKIETGELVIENGVVRVNCQESKT
jgi:hypothetical protein